MLNYNKDFYNSNLDGILNEIYEIEGARKIKEFSRQLRTFFNFKAEVIRVRFQSEHNFSENVVNVTFYSRKGEIEILSHNLINLLKRIKKEYQTLEEGIQSLYFEKNQLFTSKILDTVENISLLIHHFSEESIYHYPKFLKFIISLSKSICLIKKCLYWQFSDFYNELEINYDNLEREIESILVDLVHLKNRKKHLEGRLTS